MRAELEAENMIKSIGHAAFFVRDMSRSLAFYQGVLGLEKAFELRKENGNQWIEYLKVADNQFIELFYPEEGFNPQNHQEDRSYGHLCLCVDDIFAVADEIKKRGGTLASEPMKGIDGNYQCWINDPDGNAIEFMQIMPDSLQSSGK